MFTLYPYTPHHCHHQHYVVPKPSHYICDIKDQRTFIDYEHNNFHWVKITVIFNNLCGIGHDPLLLQSTLFFIVLGPCKSINELWLTDPSKLMLSSIVRTSPYLHSHDPLNIPISWYQHSYMPPHFAAKLSINEYGPLLTKSTTLIFVSLSSILWVPLR